MALHLNSDFNQRVVILPSDYEWIDSPMHGVERMMLDRIGDEVARATTIVRYAPYSEFSAHIHTGGEEFYVIEGVFSDERGDYAQGTYVRNPIGTSHTPKIGEHGATILVKLHQFSEQDTLSVNMNTSVEPWSQGLVEGLSVMSLHEFESEHVALVKWEPYTRFLSHQHWGGEEIFVIKGTFYDEHGEYPKGSWIRNPHKSRHQPFTKSDGAIIFVKTGHLLVL
ncbi:cupin [Shewanella sp. OPT22]|nr:cupin [Shewanella sp. OPT22]